jgi:hypothetical protein
VSSCNSSGSIFAIAVGLSGRRFLHVASYPKVGRQSDQRHGYGAQGKDQEQPDHPHDALGYQKAVERALEALGALLTMWFVAMLAYLPAIARSTSSAAWGKLAVRLINLPSLST